MGSRYKDPQGEQPGGSQKKKKKKGGGVFTTILLIAAIGVFCFAGYKLLGYYREYKKGQDEYSELNIKFMNEEPATEGSTQVADDGSSRRVLTDVKELEDPATVEEVKAGALTQQIVEGVSAETAAETDEQGQTSAETDEQGQTEETETNAQSESTASANAVSQAGTDQMSAAPASAEEAAQGAVETVPMLVNPIDFSELAKINSEVIGWLRIGALDISYPLAQGSDNEYYLHHTFRKEEVFSGCIFLNTYNTKYLTDQNSVVYGHNMKDGSMFGKLKGLQDQETYDSNPYFWIFTPNLIYQYRIFSTQTVDKQGDPYRTRFSREDFEAYLQESQDNSLIDNHGVTVSTDDRIVVLSTCTGDSSVRFIVQGRLEQIYAAVTGEATSSEEFE